LREAGYTSEAAMLSYFEARLACLVPLHIRKTA